MKHHLVRSLLFFSTNCFGGCNEVVEDNHVLQKAKGVDVGWREKRNRLKRESEEASS